MGTITKALTMEHAVFSVVFEQIEHLFGRMTSAPEVKLMASLVEGLLSGHGEAEKHLAYAALDHVLEEKGELHRLHQDHQEIDSHFRRVQGATDLVEARRLLKKALAASREHFRREEKHVFPLLERTLRADTLGDLGQAWMRNYPQYLPAAAASV